MKYFLSAWLPVITGLTHTLAAEFVVFPKNGNDVAANTLISDFLNNLLFPQNVKACITESRRVTHAWLIEADSKDIEQIMKQPEVGDVLPNSIITKNDGETFKSQDPVGELDDPPLSNLTLPVSKKLMVQKDASKDLALISWPPNLKLPKNKPKYKWDGYYYNVMAGMDQYVYIIENGINDLHSDFQKMPYKPIEWLFTPSPRSTYDDSDPTHHGSCIASKATGFTNGVSKNSHLVIVKATHSIADTIWAFALIYEDIVKRGRQRNSVVLYARSSKLPYHNDERNLPIYWKAVQAFMKELFQLGVHIVTSSGNDGKRSNTMDTIPAIWHEALPLIVAGAVTVRGEIPTFSQGIMMDGGLVHAPGVDVQCAGGDGKGGMQRINGTSAAAGMVAGLVAYFMGREREAKKSPRDMRMYVSETMSAFRAGSVEQSPEIVWNGEGKGEGVRME